MLLITVDCYLAVISYIYNICNLTLLLTTLSKLHDYNLLLDIGQTQLY